MPNDPLARLEKLAQVANEGLATVKEVADGLAALAHAIREYVQPLFDRLKIAENDAYASRAEINRRIDAVAATATQGDVELDRKIRDIALTPGPKGDKGDAVKGDPGEPGPAGSPDTPEQVRDKLEELVGDDRLDISAIKGIDAGAASVELQPRRGLFGIPSRGFFLYINGTKQGIVSSLNLVAGTGTTLAYSRASGRNDITITANGSGGGILAATGTVNGSNKSFTFTSAPTQLIIDGVPKQKTQSDGTVNWTGTTSVTLTGAPAPNYDIYGIS